MKTGLPFNDAYFIKKVGYKKLFIIKLWKGINKNIILNSEVILNSFRYYSKVI